MKKSEKIEIRMSFEEKEKLTQLADSEGQSVSELVRGLARKYAQLNMPRPRPKMSRLHMLGLVLCGLGLGAGASFSLFDVKLPGQNFDYHLAGEIEGYLFGLDINNSSNWRENLRIGSSLNQFEIEVSNLNDRDQELLRVDVCRPIENECKFLKSINLKVDIDEPVYLKERLVSGEFFSLSLFHRDIDRESFESVFFGDLE